ncbi:MAG: nuclear transport factor 2 family protein [Planctomycetota bacterium]
MNDDLARAREWARRLDVEDFASLPELLAPDALYRGPSGEMRGPDPIVASYRENAAWAHRTFDLITWGSEIASRDDGRIEITFEDRTTHRGVDHVYHCRQVLTFDGAGRIVEIEHVALPEEERALAEFFRRVGVER